jgi:hypothetical protein
VGGCFGYNPLKHLSEIEEEMQFWTGKGWKWASLQRKVEVLKKSKLLKTS